VFEASREIFRISLLFVEDDGARDVSEFVVFEDAKEPHDVAVVDDVLVKEGKSGLAFYLWVRPRGL
jgi:hypothetical protein